MKLYTFFLTFSCFSILKAQTPVYNADGLLISGEEVRVNNRPSSNTNHRMMGCTPFYEGWESGSFTPTWTQGPAPTTFTVQNTGAPVGQYYLTAAGGNNTHLQGLSTILPSVQQPDYFSWRTKNETAGQAGAYVVIGNSSVTATNCIVFCYITNSQDLRFVANGPAFNYPITVGSWHLVELKNVNYTSYTFDIYIDGVLQYTSFPFRGNIPDMDRIHIYNFGTTSIGGWDDIRVCNSMAAVNQMNAQTYATLQDAIDAATPGDTIQLLEDNNVATLTITNSVILKSGGFALNLTGLLDIPVGKTLTWWNNTMNFTGSGSISNNGTLNNRGTIQLLTGVTNSGIYKGTGILLGNLINQGSTQPGN